MIINLSILPIYLIISLSVTSAALIKNKRAPRRNIQYTRTYNYNRSLAEVTSDLTPITAMYEDDEGIKAQDIEKMAIIINNNVMNPVSKGITINHSAPQGNHSAFGDMFPFAMGTDYEENIYMKPRARSILLPAKSYKSRVPDISSDSMDIPVNRTRRRSSLVRKMRMDKSQFEAYMNETGLTKDKEAEKELKLNTEDVVKEKLVPNTKTFKRRKHLRDPVVPIIDSENYVFSHSGNFHYSYEGGDGTKAYERGELRNSSGGAGNAVEGNFSYKDKDGNNYSVTYTADEDGYRPVGDHLPTPPPIPPAIKRALAFLATKATSEPITERNIWE